MAHHPQKCLLKRNRTGDRRSSPVAILAALASLERTEPAGRSSCSKLTLPSRLHQMTNADHVGACAFLHATGTPADASWLSWIAKAGICCNLPWTICLSPAFLPVHFSTPELATARGNMQSMQLTHSFCGSQAAFQAKAQRGCPRRPMLIKAQSEPQAQVKG